MWKTNLCRSGHKTITDKNLDVCGVNGCSEPIVFRCLQQDNQRYYQAVGPHFGVDAAGNQVVLGMAMHVPDYVEFLDYKIDESLAGALSFRATHVCREFGVNKLTGAIRHHMMLEAAYKEQLTMRMGSKPLWDFVSMVVDEFYRKFPEGTDSIPVIGMIIKEVWEKTQEK